MYYFQMLDIQLDRPIAFIDIESTGLAVRSDRIVEIAIIKLSPGGAREDKVFRVNPGIPIPEEVSRIHGITDADVADCPGFAQLAPELMDLLDGCDLAGYNAARYDIPLLTEEFLRAGLVFETEWRRIVDAQVIFHKNEPRDLSAALLFYCGETHEDAHGALSDADATLRVLQGEIDKYPHLPRTVEGLHEFCNPRDPSWVDSTGKLKWSNGEIVFNFGRKKGSSLKDAIENDQGFINWMLKNDFPRDTRQIINEATEGKWPEPPLSAE